MSAVKLTVGQPKRSPELLPFTKSRKRHPIVLCSGPRKSGQLEPE
jgi:hypothetical protein